MCDLRDTTEAGPNDGFAVRAAPEWARRAASDRAAAWSSDRALDPGDTHDKGEQSLCVGEAA
jgi:hypothetical protein